MPYLYCHFKKDTDEPFYVGIGREKTRAFKLGHHSRTQFHRNIVKKHGVKISLILEIKDWNIACFWEKVWIKALRGAEYKLANLTDGGDGAIGIAAKNRKKVLCLETGKLYNSCTEASLDNNLSSVTISDVCNLKYRSANELHFIYSETEMELIDRINLIKTIEAKCAKRRKHVLVNKNYIGVKGGVDKIGRLATGPIKNSKKVICLDDNIKYPSASEAARIYNVSKSAIIELCLGKNNRKSVGGFRFAYCEDA